MQKNRQLNSINQLFNKRIHLPEKIARTQLVVGHQVATVEKDRRVGDQRTADRPGNVQALLVDLPADFSMKV